MTREEMELIRYCVHVAINYIGSKPSAAKPEECLAILDRELAKPEELEWQVAVMSNHTPGKRLTPWPATDLAEASRVLQEMGNFTSFIESRTPAGPWTPYKEK